MRPTSGIGGGAFAVVPGTGPMDAGGALYSGMGLGVGATPIQQSAAGCGAGALAML